jgi:hypothetical protein
MYCFQIKVEMQCFLVNKRARQDKKREMKGGNDKRQSTTIHSSLIPHPSSLIHSPIKLASSLQRKHLTVLPVQ